MTLTPPQCEGTCIVCRLDAGSLLLLLYMGDANKCTCAAQAHTEHPQPKCWLTCRIVGWSRSAKVSWRLCLLDDLIVQCFVIQPSCSGLAAASVPWRFIESWGWQNCNCQACNLHCVSALEEL